MSDFLIDDLDLGDLSTGAASAASVPAPAAQAPAPPPVPPPTKKKRTKQPTKGRPPRARETSTASLVFKVTEAEKEAVKAAADSYGIPVADLCRTALFTAIKMGLPQRIETL